ncbi:unnamed protein product [Bursaphelenchus xylophilus]|uniref:(pine wood nematode) hypothetical protein n=1 Tax=Bursaphelenchus xylophilus TaxID=6326 RepID=A0A7I8X2C4_BURXY|nr:unnamed protein product [Bursaphelenchus xylophilus]CAG9130940.1 unnamed protein product [Bursaphelenchus xylophilus]
MNFDGFDEVWRASGGIHFYVLFQDHLLHDKIQQIGTRISLASGSSALTIEQRGKIFGIHRRQRIEKVRGRSREARWHDQQKRRS